MEKIGLLFFQIEGKDIFGIVLGCIIGAVTSLFISHFYYLKTKPVENLVESMFDNLRTTLVHSAYPEFFDFSQARDLAIPPIDNSQPDVPQLVYAKIDKNFLTPGGSARILLRIIDHGLNFNSPSGVKIIDHRNRRLYPKSAGFGCVIADIHSSLEDKPGVYFIEVYLCDSPSEGRIENEKKYDIEFCVN